MEVTATQRGFDFTKFVDGNGVECSLQRSSAATREMIWLGVNDSDPRVCVRGEGWVPVDMPKGYLANTRMHLSREHVKALLPHLIKFAETGEIL